MAHLPLRAIPVVVLGATLVLGGASAGPRVDGAERVELEVAGLVPVGEGAGAVLVLREKGARTLLPLILPGAQLGEGQSELRGPGLLSQAIEALGARVSEVEIEHADEPRTGAKVRLAQAGRTVELVGPPSDSVALAISAKVPIVTRRKVLDDSGLTPDDLAKARRKVKAGERRL